MTWLRALGSFFVFFSFLYLLFSFLKRRNPNDDFRITILKAATLMGLFVCFVTELLGSFDRLTPVPVAACWIGASLFLAALQRQGPAFSGSIPWMATVIGGILLLLAIVAWTAPPNNWDSMTYHMSRVMHWKSNGNIDFYPTHILRELYQYPFAEILILHTVLLSGGDRLANLPQFFALAGCVAGVSAIVRMWKGGVRAEWSACLLAVTLPMAVLQATGTQNDLVTSFWLVCFAAFTVLLSVDSRFSVYAYAGMSLGLAILTKPAAGIWAAPFVCWYGVMLLRKRTLWTRMLLTASIVLLMISGTAWRNFQVFGTPLPGTLEGPAYSLSSSRHDVSGFLTVLVRNAALHLGAVPVSEWRGLVRKSVLGIQRWLNVDENDPRIIWPETQLDPAFSTHEDKAGNFVHFCLMTGSILLLLMRRAQGLGSVRPYSACLLFGFLLFSFLLRWQPWHSRLHLPLFLLALPCVALAMEWYLPRLGRNALSILLLIQVIPFLIFNESRPVLGPHSVFLRDSLSQVFVNRPELQLPYQEVASALLSANCSNAGLMMTSGDTWEYPLWVLTRDRVTFEHVGVSNMSADSGSPFRLPCAIVTTDPSIDPVELKGRVYKKALNATPLALWK